MNAGCAQCLSAVDANVHPREAMILVVESSLPIGGALVEQLCAEGYKAMLARTAEHARSLARGRPVRAVLLGVLASPHDALDLLREIRESPVLGGVWDRRVPAIVLSPTTEQLDLLRAFEAGADDFIAHPALALELRVRLAALLRRAERASGTWLWRVGQLEIDTSKRLVCFNGERVGLSPKEYELLLLLARDPARVRSRQELLREIWGVGAGGRVRIVDSHASRLRRKLQQAGAGELVVNSWGVGYRLS